LLERLVARPQLSPQSRFQIFCSQIALVIANNCCFMVFAFVKRTLHRVTCAYDPILEIDVCRLLFLARGEIVTHLILGKTTISVHISVHFLPHA